MAAIDSAYLKKPTPSASSNSSEPADFASLKMPSTKPASAYSANLSSDDESNISSSTASEDCIEVRSNDMDNVNEKVVVKEPNNFKVTSSSKLSSADVISLSGDDVSDDSTAYSTDTDYRDRHAHSNPNDIISSLKTASTSAEDIDENARNEIVSAPQYKLSDADFNVAQEFTPVSVATISDADDDNIISDAELTAIGEDANDDASIQSGDTIVE